MKNEGFDVIIYIYMYNILEQVNILHTCIFNLSINWFYTLQHDQILHDIQPLKFLRNFTNPIHHGFPEINLSAVQEIPSINNKN